MTDPEDEDLPPLKWRLNSDPLTGFDEVVVHSTRPDEVLLHAEMMDRRSIFVSIGDLCVWAGVNPRGNVEISGIERRTPISEKEFREMTQERPISDAEKAFDALQDPVVPPLESALKGLGELAESSELPADPGEALKAAMALVEAQFLPASPAMLPATESIRLACGVGLVVVAALKKHGA